MANRRAMQNRNLPKKALSRFFRLCRSTSSPKEDVVGLFELEGKEMAKIFGFFIYWDFSVLKKYFIIFIGNSNE
jgi:hypothetical protein